MDYEIISKLISEKRKAKKMTQKELALKLNISDKAISKWERGAGCPDISLLIPLSEILDISIYELLGGDNITPKSRKKVDKVIKETIEITTKESKRSIVEKILTGLAIFMFSILVLFWGTYTFGSDVVRRVSFRPERIKVTTFLDYRKFLEEKSCHLLFSNYICEDYNITLEFVTKLPLYDVKDGQGNYEYKIDNYELSYSYGDLTEKELNRHRLDKNYTKKGMIVNSLITFIFVKDVNIVSFKFADNTYIINKEDIFLLYRDKYADFEYLVNENIWQKEVIKKLNNSDYLDTFFENVKRISK